MSENGDQVGAQMCQKCVTGAGSKLAHKRAKGDTPQLTLNQRTCYEDYLTQVGFWVYKSDGWGCESLIRGVCNRVLLGGCGDGVVHS